MLLTNVFSSMSTKLGAAALVVLGATGGLAATGSLPSFSLSSAPAAIAPVAPGSQTVGTVNLDFPTSVLNQQVAEAALPVEEVVEEVVVVRAPRTAAAARPAGAAPAVPAAPQCVADVTTALGAVTAAMPAATTPEQGQVLLGQAGALVTAANGCLAEAQRVGFTGAGQLVAQVAATLTQVQALPVVAALTPEQVAQAPNVVGGIVGGVGEVVGGTLTVVGKGLNLLTGGLNMGLNLLTNQSK